MEKLIAGLRSRREDELHRMRTNALRRIDVENPDTQKTMEAERLLAAIDTELERRHIPGMLRTFREAYPGGFYDEKQAEEERNHKVGASNACRELLARGNFARHVETGNWPELYERVRSLVNMTNFIQGSFEKPKFLDALREERSAPIFFPALFNLLHGDGNVEARMDEFTGKLKQLELNKWTYATYFLFLHDPDNCMFIKPMMLKKSLEISHYGLAYEAQPSGRLYGEILAFCRWLRAAISELEPRDMIDVHSFMWHMAPTGKWADDPLKDE